MLQQIFIIFATLFIIFLISLSKIAIPMWRFLIRADSAIQLYDLFKKEVLERDFQTKSPIILSYGKYTLIFSNTNEASIEIERILNDALSYYDKLGLIAVVVDDFKVQKDELIRICYEIWTLRWKKQKCEN